MLVCPAWHSFGADLALFDFRCTIWDLAVSAYQARITTLPLRGMSGALALLAGRPPSRQGRTCREAGTQSHGSGLEPDSRTTEGRVSGRAPRTSWVSQQGDHDAGKERAVRRHLCRARFHPERRPSRDSPWYSRDPGRHLDRPHHEYRRKPPHGSGVLSALLRHGELSLPRVLLRSGGLPD